MHVIWLILKIVGILVLVLAGLFLVMLYSMLFVAASYRIQVKVKDTFRAEMLAGWLFRAVTIRCSLDSAGDWEKKLQVRLFGFLVLGDKKKKRKGLLGRWRRRRRKQKAREEEKMQEKVSEEPTEPLEEVAEETYAKREAKTEAEDKLSEEDVLAASDKITEEEPKTRTQHTSASDKKKNKSSGIVKKLQKIERAIRRKIKNIRRKITSIKDNIKRIKARKEELLAFWQAEEHRRARSSVYRELRYLWRKLRPKKIKGKVLFGFEDPSVTGLCMGGVGIMRAWYQSQLDIVPDFEHQVLEADVLIKGKVRFYVLMAVLWRVYFNKDIRHMYQSWQQL